MWNRRYPTGIKTIRFLKMQTNLTYLTNGNYIFQMTNFRYWIKVISNWMEYDSILDLMINIHQSDQILDQTI